MIATVFSAGIYGIEGYLVTVECGLVNGLPSFELVGLPGAAVKESKERVTTAARSIGMALLPARKTVNLAPADIRKEGAVYDLPILLGLLAAQGSIEQQLPDDSVFIGEISLRGELRPVKGALSMAMAVQQAGKSKLFLPEGNAEEASLIGNDLTIYAVRHVQQILDHLTGNAGCCAGLLRRHGTGKRQAGDGDCGGRRAQYAHVGQSRLGQEHDGKADWNHFAAHDAGRKNGCRAHLFHYRRGQPRGAVADASGACAAPHDERGGHRGRRTGHPDARRIELGAQRRAVSR